MTIRSARLKREMTLAVILLSFIVAAEGYRPERFARAAGAEEGPLTRMPLPPSLAAAADPERFTPETLFEIIDGEADLYLKAGFVRLEVGQFVLDGDSRQWLDMFVYRMQGHRNAFAVFSLRRSPDAVASEVARLACRYADALSFVHGPFYVEIRAAEASISLIEASRDLARAFIAANPVREPPIAELALFPTEDRVANSLALRPSGAFGFEGFDDLFTARFRLDGRENTAFLQVCASAEAATGLAAAYRNFLLEFDGRPKGAVRSIPDSWLMHFMDGYVLVFTRGGILAGVHDAPTPESAETLARRLYEGLAAGSD